MFSQGKSNCTAWVPGHPPGNPSSLVAPRFVTPISSQHSHPLRFQRPSSPQSLIYAQKNSANLPAMPPEPFPYHMSGSTIGLVFLKYRYAFILPNRNVEAVIAGAASRVDEELAGHPGRAEEVLTAPFEYLNDEYHLWLYIQDHPPSQMTWGDLEDAMPILAAWAQEFKTPECDFEIWRWPMTARQVRLGSGLFVLDAGSSPANSQ
ncbi:MAG: hypothetical protein Q9191_005950 [Dirinaria sp. TL-2023a]